MMIRGCTLFTAGIALGFLLGNQISFLSDTTLSFDNKILENLNGLRSSSSLLLSSQDSPTPGRLDSDESGWKSLEIFRGKIEIPWKTDPNDPDETKVPYPVDGYLGQAKQDAAVAKLLNYKRGGYFVDMAANHAYTLSNTYQLEHRFDWTGLCIDANPLFWHELLRFRKCQVVGAAVGKNKMEKLSFNIDAGGTAGLVGANFMNKRGGANKIDVYTIPLQEILDRFQAPRRIQYMSLDVEGAEWFIMEGFPFDQYVFELINIERPSPALIDYLRQNGYRFVKCLIWFGDLLFAHESVLPHLNLTSIGIQEPWDQLDRTEANRNTNHTHLSQIGGCRRVPTD